MYSYTFNHFNHQSGCLEITYKWKTKAIFVLPYILLIDYIQFIYIQIFMEIQSYAKLYATCCIKNKGGQDSAYLQKGLKRKVKWIN